AQLPTPLISIVEPGLTSVFPRTVPLHFWASEAAELKAACEAAFASSVLVTGRIDVWWPPSPPNFSLILSGATVEVAPLASVLSLPEIDFFCAGSQPFVVTAAWTPLVFFRT